MLPIPIYQSTNSGFTIQFPYYQIGIVSYCAGIFGFFFSFISKFLYFYIQGCGFSPGVYTRIQMFSDWIEAKIRQ